MIKPHRCFASVRATVAVERNCPDRLDLQKRNRIGAPTLLKDSAQNGQQFSHRNERRKEESLILIYSDYTRSSHRTGIAL